MNDLRQAAEQALEALRYTTDHLPAKTGVEREVDEAITALQVALAHPEQEREWTDEELDAHSRKMLIDLKKQMKCTDEEAVVRAVENMKREGWFDPETKPVAWRNTQTGEFCTGGFLEKVWDHWTPLYAAPLKREWVGLSVNEARKFYEKYTDREELIYAIDEFLEEKNT